MIVVDVGASVGEFTTYAAKFAQRVIAIEPLPDIAALIPRGPNVTIVAGGIRDVDENTTQEILRRRYSELTSFLPEHKVSSDGVWDYLRNLTDVVATVQVQVESLHSLMTRLGLQAIDFLKIDTQGLDLEVIASARELLPNIRSVILEAPYTTELSLYGQETPLVQVIQQMSAFGFYVARVVPNGGGEANAIFVNEQVSFSDYLDIETSLRLLESRTLKLDSLSQQLQGRQRLLAPLGTVARRIPVIRAIGRFFLMKRRNPLLFDLES